MSDVRLKNCRCAQCGSVVGDEPSSFSTEEPQYCNRCLAKYIVVAPALLQSIGEIGEDFPPSPLWLTLKMWLGLLMGITAFFGGALCVGGIVFGEADKILGALVVLEFIFVPLSAVFASVAVRGMRQCVPQVSFREMQLCVGSATARAWSSPVRECNWFRGPLAEIDPHLIGEAIILVPPGVAEESQMLAAVGFTVQTRRLWESALCPAHELSERAERATRKHFRQNIALALGLLLAPFFLFAWLFLGSLGGLALMWLGVPQDIAISVAIVLAIQALLFSFMYKNLFEQRANADTAASDHDRQDDATRHSFSSAPFTLAACIAAPLLLASEIRIEARIAAALVAVLFSGVVSLHVRLLLKKQRVQRQPASRQAQNT